MLHQHPVMFGQFLWAIYGTTGLLTFTAAMAIKTLWRRRKSVTDI